MEKPTRDREIDSATSAPAGGTADSEPAAADRGEDALRRRLTPEQYQVTQCSATERPFTGAYWDCHDEGVYRCVVCGAALFESATKFDSGSGWPSFYAPIDLGGIDEVADRSYGMTRTEVRCSNCGGHLGHLFEDGPNPTGMRYCINSAALDLETTDTDQDD